MQYGGKTYKVYGEEDKTYTETAHASTTDETAHTEYEPEAVEYETTAEYPAGYSDRVLVKRPEGTYYKTILSTDGGGLRSLLSAMVVIEVENAIKRYIVANPSYFHGAEHVTSVDDFDVQLVDYFDCITGAVSGTWTGLYLASRGGQGAAAAVFEDPAIIEKYGVIKPGSAEGLRVLYREYATVIYPPEVIDTSTGEIWDIVNPDAPGVETPLYPNEGLEATLTAFLGKTTLADCDTSVIMAAFDLTSGYTIAFRQNWFHGTPVTSSARLVPRVGPKTNFYPDLDVQEGDFYLVDVASGAGASPGTHAAVQMSSLNNASREFILIDGGIAVEAAAVPATFYVAAENGIYDFEKIAIISIGVGSAPSDFVPFRNAGLTQWLEELTLLDLYPTTGRQSQMSLMDYIFYANPATKPYQYLRIQKRVSPDSELGDALATTTVDNAAYLDVYEEVGLEIAELHKEAIDIFVKDYIFGS